MSPLEERPRPRRIRPAARLWADRAGVSAIEFALLLPLFLVLWAGASELTSAYMASRRVNHTAAALGDVASQQKTLTPSQITTVFSASTTLLQPFPTTSLSLRLTSVTQQPSGLYQVDWSQAQGSAYTAFAPGTTLSSSQVPTGILAASGDTVLMSEVTYVYTSAVAYNLPTGLTLHDVTFTRPRTGHTIDCTGC